MPKELTRLPDWRVRFSAFQIECASLGFQRGAHDCALYLAKGATVITGEPFAHLFGSYDDLRGAVRVLKEFGAGDLEDTVAALLPRLEAQERPRIGDAAVVRRPGGKITGFFVESGISLVAEQGLTYAPRDHAIAAFKIG